MASYNIPILIQKMKIDSEEWEDYYNAHAQINKSNGKEYVNASTNISQSTYNFTVRYCNKIEDILFNTQIYRIVYKERIFDIKNVDRYKESSPDVILVGEFNGQNYIS